MSATEIPEGCVMLRGTRADWMQLHNQEGQMHYLPRRIIKALALAIVICSGGEHELTFSKNDAALILHRCGFWKLGIEEVN